MTALPLAPGGPGSPDDARCAPERRLRACHASAPNGPPAAPAAPRWTGALARSLSAGPSRASTITPPGAQTTPGEGEPHGRDEGPSMSRIRRDRPATRRLAVTTAVAGMLLFSVAQHAGAVMMPSWASAGPPSARTVTTSEGSAECGDGALQVVAHQDDDLLFLS